MGRRRPRRRYGFCLERPAGVGNMLWILCSRHPTMGRVAVVLMLCTLGDLPQGRCAARLTVRERSAGRGLLTRFPAHCLCRSTRGRTPRARCRTADRCCQVERRARSVARAGQLPHGSVAPLHPRCPVRRNMHPWSVDQRRTRQGRGRNDRPCAGSPVVRAPGMGAGRPTSGPAQRRT